MKASMLTKGGCKPSGAHEDGFFRILNSRAIAAATNLGKTWAPLIKKLCIG